MNPKKSTDIFPYICNFIFAIILANSYGIASKVFLYPEKVFFSDLGSIIPALELILAYFTIIFGWVGYSRSLIKWPFTIKKVATARFLIDLIILFCYFGLITSTNENEFREHFLIWLIALFILFFIWDIIKFFEHRKKSYDWRLIFSGGKTLLFMVIFILIYVGFIYSQNYQFGLFNQEVIYVIFLILTIVIMGSYRYTKWIIPQESRPTKK